MNVTPLDGIAFNHLLNGDADMAKSIWMKKDDVSSLQNRLILSAINKEWEFVISYAESLYSRFSNDFMRKIVGETISMSTPLWQMFIDELIFSGKDALSLLDLVSISEWRSYIAENTIAPLIDDITQQISLAKTSKGKGAKARFEAGNILMTSTKGALTQLRHCLPISDLRYQTIVDKLATEILQCGIDYFNETQDDDAPQKATILQNYALSIAVGKMVKDRCKENIDILNKVGIEYCVRREINQLTRIIRRLRNDKEETNSSTSSNDDRIERLLGQLRFSRGLSDISTLVNQCVPLLATIKNKLGRENNLYISISSTVASSAINAIVEIVNQKLQYFVGYDKTLTDTIEEARALLNTVGALDMNTKTWNYYSNNKDTLDKIYGKLDPYRIHKGDDFYRINTTSSDYNYWGCIIPLIIFIVIMFIFIYVNP